jgi:hypothetical protein
MREAESKPPPSPEPPKRSFEDLARDAESKPPAEDAPPDPKPKQLLSDMVQEEGKAAAKKPAQQQHQQRLARGKAVPFSDILSFESARTGRDEAPPAVSGPVFNPRRVADAPQRRKPRFKEVETEVARGAKPKMAYGPPTARKPAASFAALMEEESKRPAAVPPAPAAAAAEEAEPPQRKKKKKSVDDDELFWGTAERVDAPQDWDGQWPTFEHQRGRRAGGGRGGDARVDYIVDRLNAKCWEDDWTEFAQSLVDKSPEEIARQITVMTDNRKAATEIAWQYQRRFLNS